MSFLVSDFLKLQVIGSSRIVAGDRGGNNSIRSVSIMDAPDTSWLKRGDLLLTTGYVFKDHKDTQIKLLNDLAGKHCAGLAIKVKRFFSEIPAVMLQEADRLGLPLIELSSDIVLSDLLLSVTKEIVNYEDLSNKKNSLVSLIMGHPLEHGDLELISHQYKFMPNSNYIAMMISVNPYNGDKSVISQTTFAQMANEIGNKVNAKLLMIPNNKDFAVILNPLNLKKPLELAAIARKTARLLGNQIQKKFPKQVIQIGIGSPCIQLSRIHKSYKEAKEAVHFGKTNSDYRNLAIYEYADYAPEGLFQQLSDDVLKNYVKSTLEVLTTYDQENNSNLLQTLEAFLESGGKLAETANVLFVHRNTVKFRILRIEELLGIDLNESKTAFRLQLGLRIARMLDLLPCSNEVEIKSMI
ncbi:PucR family transcriptional regulator [Bacillus salipaludis]|uniref:PucR family transcriptional regulator ligand-binding domain-containing protein n=1 Tax=Bacillus salipaludis TaxID=2547811 RepID=A0AA90TVM5_9BACI|nr:PucR family transcriptional regulator ligand-binding domain-containing protein [Bacillus salipaludis]MDQ6596638.1 PucR family transcriptional regulator ligand-binding domain-containing protein [Bacillus salipaludis]